MPFSCFRLLFLLLPILLSAGAPCAAHANPAAGRPPQLLRIVNNSGADVLNLCVTHQRQVQYVRLDMPPKGSDLVDQVNQALSQLLQDGTVEQIFQEYDTVYVSPLS